MSEQTTTWPVPGRPQGRSVRRLVVRLLTAALVVLVGSTAVFLGWYRTEFRAWPWASGPPDRVTYCGRHYIGPGQPVTSAKAAARDNGLVREVGHTGVGGHGQAIYAVPLPEQSRADNPPRPCAMVVYLRTGKDRYVPYVLSGGP